MWVDGKDPTRADTWALMLGGSWAVQLVLKLVEKMAAWKALGPADGKVSHSAVWMVLTEK